MLIAAYYTNKEIIINHYSFIMTYISNAKLQNYNDNMMTNFFFNFDNKFHNSANFHLDNYL